jgi:predicted MPP superfamily phosphohydrolase
MFSPFRVTLLLLVLALAQILGWRLWRRRFERPVSRRVVTGLFIVFNLAWLVFIWRWRVDRNFTEGFLIWVARPAVAWQALHVFFIVPFAAFVSIVYSLLAWLKRATVRAKEVDAPATPAVVSRRHFLQSLANVGFYGLIGCSVYAVYRQYRFPDVKRLTLTIPDLPRALDGFTIAQLSDTHIGLWSTENELAAAMATARAEKPDLVVLTGDLVDRDPNMAALFAEPFQRHLQKIPYGVYGILGNHDHFTNPARIAQILREIGIKMLIDRRVNLLDLPLSLWGLDDRGRRFVRRAKNDFSDPDVLDFQPVRGPNAPPDFLKVLLNHRPEGVSQAANAGFQVYLAGHTHGGQYALPGTNGQANLAAFFYQYTSGLYQVGACNLNVSAGLAAVGAPFRLVAWPEISLIRLKRT